MRYRTMAGEDLEFPTPSAEVLAFLLRVQNATYDETLTEAELTALVYGKDNPLLDQTIFPERGAVTKATFADPAYHMMLDLLGRKAAQKGTLDLARAALRYSMTVADAAAQLGISESAVRQAIVAHRLPAWRKSDGTYGLDPQSVSSYRVSRRGPAPGSSKRAAESAPVVSALDVRTGSSEGASLRVKAPGELAEKRRDGSIVTGRIEQWKRVGVVAGRGDKTRFWAIEPSDEENAIEFEGFYVRGRFTILESTNNSRGAQASFKAFVAE